VKWHPRSSITLQSLFTIMINQLIVARQANYWGTIIISKLQCYNCDKQTMVVQLQQANYSSKIMIDKLLWYDYDKPCFYSFRGEEKEHKQEQKRKVREEKRKKKKKKNITSPGSSIDPANGKGGDVQVLGGAAFTVIFLSFYSSWPPPLSWVYCFPC